MKSVGSTKTKPPARLKNGKNNPEYQKLYESTRRKRIRKLNSDIQKGSCKCVECEVVFDQIEAGILGFRYLRSDRHRGVCRSCLNSETESIYPFWEWGQCG